MRLGPGRTWRCDAGRRVSAAIACRRRSSTWVVSAWWRGHSFFAQSGHFELLGNIEYTFVIDDLEHGVMFFYDAGTAWNSTVIDLEESVVLQSLGFAFKSLDDDFQIGFAWPIGTVGGDLEVSVRLNRTF
jgi:hypothetical protein